MGILPCVWLRLGSVSWRAIRRDHMLPDAAATKATSMSTVYLTEGGDFTFYTAARDKL